MTINLSFQDRFAEIRNKWFLMEPAYFMVLCTHKVEFNKAMKCDIAVGRGSIFINEDYFTDKSDKYLEECLKAEILRILLKHPYQRQLPNKVKMLLSSNFVLGNNTNFSEFKLNTTQQFFGSHEYDRASLEEIYDALKIEDPSNGQGNGKKPDNKQGQNGQGQGDSSDGEGEGGQSEMQISPKSGNGGKRSLQNFDDACQSTNMAIEKTQMWQEDEYRQVEVNNIIEKIDKTTNGWGNMPGNIVDAIKKSIEPKFNYKAVFQQFRSTVLSSK